MKNVKKFLAVVSAVAAMSASMTAFADTSYTPGGEFTFTYDSTKNSISLDATAVANAESGSEMTLLVLKSTAVETDVKQDDILYIDQATKGTDAVFQNMGLKGTITDLVDGVYPVKLGYKDNTTKTFAIKKGTLTVATSTTGTEITFVFGDVDGNGEADSTDATYIATKANGGAKKYGQAKYSIGDTVTLTVPTTSGN